MKGFFLNYQTGLLFLVSFLVAVVMNFSWGEIPSGIEVGKIARQDIRADRDYQIVDEEETEKLRHEETAKVKPIYKEDEVTGKSMVDEEETQIVQRKAMEAVKPVTIRVQAGESVIRRGDRFEKRHEKIINGIRQEKERLLGRTRLIGTFFFVGLFLSTLLFAFQRVFSRLKMGGRDFLFLGTLLLVLVSLVKVVLFVSGAVRELLPLEIPLSSFYALVPVASFTMMARFVLPLPIAILFATVSAALAGEVLQGSLYHTLYYLVGSILGIRLIATARSRGQILKAGFQLGTLNAITLFSLDLVYVTSLSDILTVQDIGVRMMMGFVGGVVNALVVLSLMPIFESLFNYLTPIKLLEFGSLNHPLLREMIVRAPGTYHHSHMVGTLAEAACEAIGADSLFARVASYFHDIGKLKKPTYFIENQPPAEDRHGSLAPSMSALIISSHVKDGMELARQHKLPQKIIDIIPQHQGTKLISYFYNKAKESEDPSVHVADEREYRYPGPRPQTREAGVILLADTVEAATRALKDRSPSRLEEVVRNMINKNFIDGQLDECELTLKDLHTIAKSFVRILMGIYHQRVEYPPEAPEAPSGDGLNDDKYLQSKPISESSFREAPEKPPANIHRIGADRSRR